MTPEQIAELTLNAAQEQAWWEAASVWVSGIGLLFTGCALVFAGWQVKALHEQITASKEAAAAEALESRKWKTLDQCHMYDTNSNLVESANKVHAFFEGPPDKREWKTLYRPAVNVLNYLDAIAIGVLGGVYDKGIVDDHLKPIIVTQVQRLLLNADAEKIGIPTRNFPCLIKVYNEFAEPKLAFRQPKNESV